MSCALWGRRTSLRETSWAYSVQLKEKAGWLILVVVEGFCSRTASGYSHRGGRSCWLLFLYTLSTSVPGEGLAVPTEMRHWCPWHGHAHVQGHIHVQGYTCSLQLSLRRYVFLICLLFFLVPFSLYKLNVSIESPTALAVGPSSSYYISAYKRKPRISTGQQRLTNLLWYCPLVFILNDLKKFFHTL